MGGYKLSGILVLSVGPSLFCGCAATPDIDLTRNEYLYQSPGYEAPRRTAAAVYVKRLRDRREPPVTNATANYQKVFSDDVWARPIPVMVEELLIDEIDRSGIYNGISSGSAGHPRQADYIIEPTLLSMYRMREAMVDPGSVGMRRTVAVTSIKLRVFGPAEASGRRALLMDQIFPEVVATRPSLGRPEEGLALTGQGWSRIMRKALVKLYESNSTDEQPTPGEKAEPTRTAEPARPTGK